MIVTAWNNSKHWPSGGGYGIKIKKEDRDRYFDKKWKSVFILLKGKSDYIEVNSNKKSFWDDVCRELSKKDIGIWLKENYKVPWPKSHPPKMNMECIDSNKFKLDAIK